jgi:hypothetical protein
VIVQERQKTHGQFSRNAEAAQHFKEYLRSHPGWHLLNEQQKEALELIATKTGRILAGDPNHPDHWRDIGGYAELGRRACNAE